MNSEQPRKANLREQIILSLNQSQFIDRFCKEIATPGVRPIDVVEQLLAQELTASITTNYDEKISKSPIVCIYPIYNKNRWRTLRQLAEEGYETWYIEIRFTTKSGTKIDNIDLRHEGFSLESIEYAQGIKRAYQIKSKTLKRQVNHSIRLNHLRLEKSVFTNIIKLLSPDSIEQPYIANPQPGLTGSGLGIGIPGFEFLCFDHIITGSRIFCDCAKSAHAAAIAKAQIEAPGFVPNSWPHRVIELLSKAKYQSKICHMCIAREAGADAAAAKYGDTMQEFLEPYINQLIRTDRFDLKTARAEVMEILKLSRWIQEAELYRLIKQIFPDDLVLREASPPWLARQRLDVFLPRQQLAIEYQGAQHYVPVEHFGGMEALKRTKERDLLKKRLCEENNIDLVYFKHDEALTLFNVRHRLRRYLKI